MNPLKNENDLPISIRDFIESDKHFILSCWLKSFRDSKAFQGIPNERFFTMHKKVVEELLKRSKTMMLVDQKDPDHLFGFISYELNESANYLHFVYIKNAFRRLGLAKKVIFECIPNLDNPTYYTHQTYASPFLAPLLNAKYYPYGVNQ